ncbi:LuxR C-terminal-related transcriptional regulator [Lentzea sp. NPDC059081]|uniref:helix-turn-helix domain-containing protein n=1 Tax=Lentzea sp. NPDC059081 TaxID=3346719 RepID=UPI0036743D21
MSAPTSGSVPAAKRYKPWRPTTLEPSARELQVLLGMSHGQSYAQVGRSIGIAENTVRTHARHLYRRTGARDASHAVRIGFERGWLVASAEVPAATSEVDGRPLQILQLLSEGLSYPRLATRLGLRHFYVKELSKKLYAALGVHDRTHAVRRGFELGLLQPRGARA